MISHEGLWNEFLATKDAALRERIAVQYAPLVRYVINSMSMMVPPLTTMDDMVGYGTIGLMHAIDRFDPSRGVTFETYAMQRIRGSIIDALRSMNTFSRSDTARVRAMEQAVERLTQELQRNPTEDEIANALGVTRDEVERTLVTSNVTFVSLERPLGGDASDGGTLRDLLEDASAVAPGDVAEYKELRDLLAQGIRQLSARSRLIISLYYVEELTPLEIAETLGISRSRVYQLHAKAVAELRAWMRAALTGRRPQARAEAA